jgi:hypothetical protein
MKKRLALTIVLAVIYFVSYLIFRSINIETGNKDGNKYVIFPKEQVWIYYLYRPLTHIDGNLTAMHFHIGPHR